MAAMDESGYNIYFGDIHNHNNIGVGKGSLERSFDIAQSHLDFYSFTPHCYADYTPTSGKDAPKYVKLVQSRWNDIQALTKQYHEPGRFVTFPGYERFSKYGHYHIIFPFDDQPLEYFNKLSDFQKHVFERGGITVPHHPGYMNGRAGISPELWDMRITPVLDIFSEHGNAECDTAPHDYIRHSMGPRCTQHTLQGVLEAGYRVGVVASTDDHLGFPGAYGEGKIAVHAKELTREAIFDAIKKRHTYGVTGDRITVDFRLNNRLMGEELPFSKKREIAVNVSGWDWVERVEVLKNNHVIYDESPFYNQLSEDVWNEPVLVRIEFGWGPLASGHLSSSADLPVFDWNMRVDIQDGNISDVQSCFQSGPLDENRRNRVSNISDTGLTVTSYTSRYQAFNERDTNAVVLKAKGNPNTNLVIELDKPTHNIVKVKFSDLFKHDHIARIPDRPGLIYHNELPGLSLKIHRFVPLNNATASFAINDSSSGKEVDWYYIRVAERNGQLAWSSPIWVEKRD